MEWETIGMSQIQRARPKIVMVTMNNLVGIEALYYRPQMILRWCSIASLIIGWSVGSSWVFGADL